MAFTHKKSEMPKKPKKSDQNPNPEPHQEPSAVQQDPDRQPRRDRLPRHPHRKRLGIKTVAVYSEADADALHVREADEAVLIGPPPSTQSYLLIDKIIEACKKTGAQAVHPGYGFLSENAGVRRRRWPRPASSSSAPTHYAIEAMGDKIESKKLAAEGRRQHRPGLLRALIRTPSEAVKIAKRDRLSGDDQGLGRRRRQGHAHRLQRRRGARGLRLGHQRGQGVSFGDDRVFIEKFVEEPRHIEIQVLGDAHGNCLYLWERECSIQRRHQKVIEEAPSPFLDAKTRKAMGEQAVALAKAVQLQERRHGRVHRRQEPQASTSSR